MILTELIDLVDKQIASIQTQNAGITEEMEVIDRQIAQVNESIHKCYIRESGKRNCFEQVCRSR